MTAKVQILDYLHVRSAYSPVYSHDGNTVRFISNLSGEPQLWEIRRGEDQPRQLPSVTDRILAAKYFPTDNRMMISADVGGNERQGLWLLDETGQFQAITSRPECIYQFGGISKDGKHIAWSSNERNPAFFDIYIYSVETGTSARIFEHNGTNQPVAFHPDGTRLLIRRNTTNMNHDLYMIDIDTGREQYLTPHSGEARYEDIHISRDGNSIYVLSDADKEYMGIARIDLQSLDFNYIAEYAWDVENLAMHPDGQKLAYTVNEEGYSQLYVLDLSLSAGREWQKSAGEGHGSADTAGIEGSAGIGGSAGAKSFPAIPKGVVEGLQWSPDGERLCFSLDGSTHPKDLWEMNIRKERAERLTFVSDSPVLDQLVEPELIRYTSFDGMEIPAFYYRPKAGDQVLTGNMGSSHAQAESATAGASRLAHSSASPASRLPVVVYVHGGPESQTRASFHPLLQYLVHRGFAVLATNVRGSTGYGRTFTHLDDVRKRMDSVADLASAVEWLKADGGADPDAIAVMGRSYGGFMVLAAITTYPDLWACAIDQVGIANFRTFLENTGPWRRKLREPEYGSLENDGEFLDEISPIHHIHKITAPLLVQHGRNDPRVPVGEAEQIVAGLQKLGREVEYICYEDEGHPITKLPNLVHAYTAFADFLEKWMGRTP